MTVDRLTLERGQWYGMTMFPGYFDCPYHSPIRVDEITLLGNRQFELTFLNLGYAAGVQGFKKRLKTLRRTGSHLVVEGIEEPERTYVFVPLNAAWLGAHLPDLAVERYFDAYGRPNGTALMTLAATAW